MDETTDEKKPDLSSLADPSDPYAAEPDPDEQLMLDQGHGRVWLVKIPKDIMARWAAINKEDVHLATIRVYTEPNGPGKGGRPRIVLFLPPHRDTSATTPTATGNGSRPGSAAPSPAAGGMTEAERKEKENWPGFGPDALRVPTDAEPDCYELEMLNEAVDNQIVVAERPKDSSFGLSSNPTASAQAAASSRARTTILTGRIKHDCSLRPTFSANYRKQMRERHRKYNTPHRQIQMIEQAGIAGGRGGINRMSVGVGVGSGGAFSDLVKTKPKPAKGTFERMARMPRNQLLDLIFQLFQDPQTPRWGIKPLRERTQQPEAYLKEVLSEVAFLHRSGEWNGLWELKEMFKEEGIKPESIPGPSNLGVKGEDQDVKMEDDYDDDDDDDDMEEVS